MHPLRHCWDKPQQKGNLAAEKNIASTKAFSVFLNHRRVIWWLWIRCLYLLVLWKQTRSNTLFCRDKCFELGPFVNTGCSGWGVKLLLLLAGFFCSKELLKCHSFQNWINYLIDRLTERKLEAIWSDQSSSHCGISFIHPTHSFQLLPPGHCYKFLKNDPYYYVRGPNQHDMYF